MPGRVYPADSSVQFGGFVMDYVDATRGLLIAEIRKKRITLVAKILLTAPLWLNFLHFYLGAVKGKNRYNT